MTRVSLLTAAGVLLAAGSLQAAAPTITPAGAALGFTITTFATPDPGKTTCCGPFGVTVLSNGNITVSDAVTNVRYVWPDIDGQTIGSAITSTASNSGAAAYANAGGKPYGAYSGRFVQFKDDATVDHILTGVTPGPTLGMWGNPVNGHIIALSSVGLIDIDPLDAGGLGSYRFIVAVNGDGLSVSPDGKTAYIAFSPNIRGYDIATGALVFGPVAFPSPDGTGVISSFNSLNGQIVVNDNNGSIYLLDPVAMTSVIIASGGTRGDYVSPDTNNGTLFLDYTDVVARLSCGAGCSFAGPPRQITLDRPYQIRYASNLTAGDSVINITNTGANGNNLFGPGFGGPAGNICVNVYAFSPDEQLISCCSCLVTPNGLVHLTANNDLVSNTLTGIRPDSIVIKLIATGTGIKTGTTGTPDYSGSNCTNSAALAGTLFPLTSSGMLAMGTTLHTTSNIDPPPAGSSFSVTETPFLPATLGLPALTSGPGLGSELASLTNRCTNIIGNGSTFGICRSCRLGGLGGSKI